MSRDHTCGKRPLVGPSQNASGVPGRHSFASRKRQRPYRTLFQDAQGATAVGLALPVGIGTGSGTGTVSRSLQPALVD